MKKIIFALTLTASNLIAMADGPIGFGAIKLGMTKIEIENLPESEPVRTLPGSTVPYVSKYTAPAEGIEKFSTLLRQPFNNDYLETILDFREGKLVNIHVSVKKESEYILEKISEQISEKYGKAETKDTRKEEQCIYKNGSNFKIVDGGVTHFWFDDKKLPGKLVETRITNTIFQSCPSNLRYATTPIHILSMGIGVTNKKEKVQNAF